MSSVAQKKREKVDTSDIDSSPLPIHVLLRVFLINPKTNVPAHCGKTAHIISCLDHSQSCCQQLIQTY